LGKDHLLADEILVEVNEPEISLHNQILTMELANAGNLIAGKPVSDRPVILVVEDIADVREFIRMSLGNQYQILEATNGKEGLSKILEDEPDLIISDVMMPEMDGLELTRRLKSDLKTCHIPVILLTAKAAMEHKLEGLEEGADSYIPKPFNSSHLQVRVKKLLELRMKIREHYRGMPDAQEEETGINRLDKKFLNKLTLIIEENLNKEDISVDELGQKIGISRVHLYRKIKKLTDMSVSEFVIMVKLKKSLELLRNSGKTIAEIAFEVGFSSPSYYTRCFREQFKMSPTEYMQNKKGEK
jgi:YesN/AraC family two-component response regulator